MKYEGGYAFIYKGTRIDELREISRDTVKVKIFSDTAIGVIRALPQHVNTVKINLCRNIRSLVGAFQPHITTVEIDSGDLAQESFDKELQLKTVRKVIILSAKTANILKAIPAHITDIEYRGTDQAIKKAIAERQAAAMPGGKKRLREDEPVKQPIRPLKKRARIETVSPAQPAPVIQQAGSEDDDVAQALLSLGEPLPSSMPAPVVHPAPAAPSMMTPPALSSPQITPPFVIVPLRTSQSKSGLSYLRTPVTYQTYARITSTASEVEVKNMRKDVFRALITDNLSPNLVKAIPPHVMKVGIGDGVSVEAVKAIPAYIRNATISDVVSKEVIAAIPSYVTQVIYEGSSEEIKTALQQRQSSLRQAAPQSSQPLAARNPVSLPSYPQALFTRSNPVPVRRSALPPPPPAPVSIRMESLERRVQSLAQSISQMQRTIQTLQAENAELKKQTSTPRL